MRYTLIFSLILGFVASSSSQVFHEVSLMSGPVSVRGDYGLRGDSQPIKENLGLGVGFNHFINFAYSDYFSKHFREHFKLRSSLVYHTTNLRHYGALADKENDNGLKLRSMFGEANVLEIGTGLEYSLQRIIDYERNTGSFTPYVGIGLNFVYFTPLAATTLDGGLGIPETTFPTFLAEPGEEAGFTNDANVTLSTNFQVGSKYKLTKESDLFIELRWHYYFSDYIDGLQPIGDQNMSNDWVFWLTVGYVYYIPIK